MSKGVGIYNDFRKILNKQAKSNIAIQTVWVKCKEVDWDNKTMTAIDTNNLPYYDVLLGLDLYQIQPKVETKCLIGIIENNTAQAFLINCDEAEKVVFMQGENKGMLKIEPTIDKLNAIENKINDLIQVFTSWIPVSQDGGAALKSALSSFVSQQLQLTQIDDLENKNIVH